jgi:hypothetical protein
MRIEITLVRVKITLVRVVIADFFIFFLAFLGVGVIIPTNSLPPPMNRRLWTHLVRL